MFDLYRMSATPNPRAILRREEVLRRTGLKTTGLYERIKEGGFPSQVSIGARAVGWYEDEVQDWIRERPAVVKRGRRSAEAVQGVGPDKHPEHTPADGEDKELAAAPERAQDDALNQMPKRKPARRLKDDAPLGHRNAVARTADVGEPQELKLMRVENSRLKVLLAELMLENDALRSALV